MMESKSIKVSKVFLLRGLRNGLFVISHTGIFSISKPKSLSLTFTEVVRRSNWPFGSASFEKYKRNISG